MEISIDGLGETIELAEFLGWIDTFGDASTGWNDRDADAAEESAIDHIESKGITPVFEVADDVLTVAQFADLVKFVKAHGHLCANGEKQIIINGTGYIARSWIDLAILIASDANNYPSA